MAKANVQWGKSGKSSSPHSKFNARGAIEVLASIEASPLLPQQVAVLVSGSLLMCSWRFISERLQSFETRGLQSLLEVWMVVAASFGLGQLARAVARSAAVVDLVSEYRAAAQQRADASSSKVTEYLPAKEGRETGTVTEPAADEVEDQDDVGVQKRIAQAEAAAKLAQYQSNLRQLLGSIGKSGSIAGDAQFLYKLADQLFSSPVNVSELVNQGGVPVVMAAARLAVQELSQQPNQADVLPSLLQVSWVLLQVAHGPPACCAALANEDVALTLLEVTRTAMAAPAVHTEAKESILRNLSWILLVLCDGSKSADKAAQQSSSAGGRAAAAGSAASSAVCCAAALVNGGAVELLQQLTSLQFGVSPGWVAAATLGLFMQLGQQQQQEQQQQPVEQQQQQQQCDVLPHIMCESAVQAMLQTDSLHGVGYLLTHQPQLSDRLKGLVYGQLHYLLTFHTEELLQLLVEEHLVGSFAAGASPKLGRLLVCQMLSSKGQEVLANIESAYELDVPLALAQVIPLPVHLKLPAAPGQQQQQQQQHGEIHPDIEPEIQPEIQLEQAVAAGAAAQPAAQPAAVPVVDDVYTDVLACRLLLQHSRLDELLTAFADELMTAGLDAAAAVANGGKAAAAGNAAAAAAAAAASGEADGSRLLLTLSPVCDAVLKLVQHLMSRDLELQAAQHVRGDSIDDSISSMSSSNSSAIDVALSMPDVSGVYSQVLSGLVPQEQLPAAADAAAGGLLVLPPLPAGAAESSSSSASGEASGRVQVVFHFGELQYAVDRAMFKQIKQSSKFVRSILSRQEAGSGQPVTVFTTPHFTHEANCWVLRCLERFLATGGLLGFTAQQAAKLWVAADFLQVDGLQVACEDVLVAAAAEDAVQLEVALELCARHRCSSARLQRLAAQVVLRGVNGSGPDAGLSHLRALLAAHKNVLLPGMHGEVRDRLVTLCMLNAGLDDDTPEDVVE